jgi:hypothetical protein
MSRNNKDQVKLCVEVLEGRQVPSAHLASTLPTPAPAATTAPAGGQVQVDYAGALRSTAAPAASLTYAVFSLRNRTRQPLHFQLRWSDQSTWSSYTLAPGAGSYFWLTGFPTPQVRLVSGFRHSRPVQYTLKYNTVTQAAAPGWAEAMHYTVTRVGHNLVLSRTAS